MDGHVGERGWQGLSLSLSFILCFFLCLSLSLHLSPCFFCIVRCSSLPLQFAVPLVSVGSLSSLRSSLLCVLLFNSTFSLPLFMALHGVLAALLPYICLLLFFLLFLFIPCLDCCLIILFFGFMLHCSLPPCLTYLLLLCFMTCFCDCLACGFRCSFASR